MSSSINKRQTWFKKLCCIKQYDTPAMQQLYSDPDKYIAESKGPFFKHEAHEPTTVFVVEIEGQQFVVKRYNVRNWVYAIKMRLRRSRAMRSWRNALYLQKHGFAAIKPVAVIEQRFGLLRGKAYFISEYIDGERGCDYFSVQQAPSAQCQQAMHSLALTVQKLAQHNIAFRDLQWGNFVVKDHQAYLLDFDYMQRHWLRATYARHYHKNIQHFFNLIKTSDIAIAYFLQAFIRLGLYTPSKIQKT